MLGEETLIKSGFEVQKEKKNLAKNKPLVSHLRSTGSLLVNKVNRLLKQGHGIFFCEQGQMGGGLLNSLKFTYMNHLALLRIPPFQTGAELEFLKLSTENS